MEAAAEASSHVLDWFVGCSEDYVCDQCGEWNPESYMCNGHGGNCVYAECEPCYNYRRPSAPPALGVVGVVDDVQHMVRCCRGVRSQQRQSMVDQLLALLGRDEWQFERSVDVDEDGDVEEGKEAQPSAAGAAADRTLGLFSSNWPDRARVRGDRSLKSLLCDVGLIGAAAAAAPNSVKVSLAR